MNKKHVFDLVFIFSSIALLTFFFVGSQSPDSFLFGSVHTSLIGKSGQAVAVPKSDYKAVYNCRDYPSYSVSGKRMGYGFGLKSDSVVSRKVTGFGYGYCMNFASSRYINQQCLVPEYKKVYECYPSSECASPSSTAFKAVSGMGYGYGFSKDSLLSYGKRTGWGFGSCVSYAPAYFPYGQASYYLNKSIKCQAGVK